MCHLCIFTARKDCDGVNDGEDRDGNPINGDETFLEAENRALAARSHVQSEAILSLEEEATTVRERGELEARIVAAEIRAEMNDKLHETDKKAKEKAEADRSFFMAALHEVRNPLNGIVLTVEHISDSLSHLLTAELEKELKTIETCASHQEMLLKGILFLDKYLSGEEELPTEEFNPIQLCRDVVAMTSNSAKEGVTICVKDNTNLRASTACFEGAPTQLNLVLVNLLSNAAKFTATGKIELCIEVEKDCENDDSAVFRFAVTDTGPGVPPEFQASIFGMRNQTDDVSARVQGFGIGLFVAHELAGRMGGLMKLKSPVHPVHKSPTMGGRPHNGGSEFSFSIRLDKSVTPDSLQAKKNKSSPKETLGSRLSKRSQHESPAVLSRKLTGAKPTKPTPTGLGGGGEKEKHSMQGWRVIIADDSEVNSKLLMRKFSSGMFKELEWQVETAATGEEALERIRAGRSAASGATGRGEVGPNRRRFDMAVFDEHMEPFGKLLGTEATRILRAMDEEVLIVGFTGNCGGEDEAKSEESGQDLFWSKPVPPSKAAMEALETALAERQSKKKKKEQVGANGANEANGAKGRRRGDFLRDLTWQGGGSFENGEEGKGEEKWKIVEEEKEEGKCTDTSVRVLKEEEGRIPGAA